MSGLITLDIDGTLTSDLVKIPNEVVHYLERLSKRGWTICLVTGRSFYFAEPSIRNLSFPFFLGILNGALILEMPSKKIIKRHYIQLDSLSGIEKICENEPTDFVIYSGFESGDVVYYRPDHLPPDLCKYLEERARSFSEIWKPVDDFRSLEIKEFPSIKCIGSHDVIQRVASRTRNEFHLSMPVIRDPKQESFYVGVGTDVGINKGKVLKDLKELLSITRLVIAAGDDYNDIPMLEEADISIVMETAPQEMHALADIIAKPASQNGIIDALGTALGMEK